VASNVVPERVSAIVRRFKAGDLKGAREAQLALNALIRALFVETNPAPIKAAMALRGYMRDECDCRSSQRARRRARSSRRRWTPSRADANAKRTTPHGRTGTRAGAGARRRDGRRWTDGRRADRGAAVAEGFVLSGATAREGREIIGLDAGLVAGAGPSQVTIRARLEEAIEKASVVIDFTNADASLEHARSASSGGSRWCSDRRASRRARGRRSRAIRPTFRS